MLIYGPYNIIISTVSTLNEEVTPPGHSSMESTGAKPKKGKKTKVTING